MVRPMFHSLLTAAALVAFSLAGMRGAGANAQWQEKFDIASCNLMTTGRNAYFVLEPGFQLVLEGGDEKLQITVLPETHMVDGVVTRVVEEKEWKDEKLHEISRNYFAICEQTKDVFYFGEDVDYYKDGKVVRHDGSWLAGKNGNRAGLIIPGTPQVGMKYYQEIAPGMAMDRAEIVSLDETCKTPAGTFSKCMKVKESTPLNNDEEDKYHAPGIGLVRDADLRLIKYGVIKDK
jgi:hypothetical protein